MNAADFDAAVVSALPKMTRSALVMTKDQTKAEDLVGLAVEKAYRARASVTTDDIKPWLMMIMRNSFITDYHRARRHWRLEPKMSDSMYGDRTEGVSVGYEDSIDRTSTKALIHEAMDTMSEVYRRAIQLVEFDGLTYLEAAAVEGVPLGTIMSRISRARGILYHLLHDHAVEIGIVTGEEYDSRPSVRARQ